MIIYKMDDRKKEFEHFCLLSKDHERFFVGQVDITKKQIIREFVFAEVFAYCLKNNKSSCELRLGESLYLLLQSLHTFDYMDNENAESKIFFDEAGKVKCQLNPKFSDDLVTGYYPDMKKICVNFVWDDGLSDSDFAII